VGVDRCREVFPASFVVSRSPSSSTGTRYPLRGFARSPAGEEPVTSKERPP
jgi:hypothetical protein